MELIILLLIIIILNLYQTELKKSKLFLYDRIQAGTIDCSSSKVPSITLSTVIFSKGNVSNLYIATLSDKSKIQFMSNLDITNTNIKPNKVFLLVHGMTRNMKGYFSMANNAWGKNTNIIVWAPRFPIQSEIPDTSYNYWSQTSAATGDASKGPSETTSFEILDAINGQFFKTYPITTAVLSGHSFGGQCLSRYTGLSYLPEIFPNIKIYYCILSPSSYLWITSDRPESSNCSPNNWFYGLDRLNVYANKMGATNIYCNFINRNVIVMCGTADTQSAMLDQSCQANAQGANRYIRAQNFIALMQKLDAKNFQYEYFNGGHGTNLKGKLFTNILS